MAEKTRESKAYDELIKRALASIYDFGGAVKESAVPMISGLADMWNASRGDPFAAEKVVKGLYDTAKEYNSAQAYPGSVFPSGKQLAIGGELLTGIPLRQVGGEVSEGKYAKALGHAVPGALALGLGAKGAKPARTVTPKPKISLIDAVAPTLDSRISGLPPTERVQPTRTVPPTAYEHALEKNFGVDKSPREPRYPASDKGWEKHGAQPKSVMDMLEEPKTPDILRSASDVPEFELKNQDPWSMMDLIERQPRPSQPKQLDFGPDHKNSMDVLNFEGHNSLLGAEHELANKVRTNYRNLDEGALADREVTNMLRRSHLSQMDNLYQQTLPTDVPVISYDPSLNVRDVESAGKILNEAVRDYKNLSPETNKNLVNTAKFIPGNEGVFHKPTKSMELGMDGPGDPANTIGHEFQHAIDEAQNPKMLEDYPESDPGSLTPEGYWTHPSEVRARTSGNMLDFFVKSREAGQGTLDPNFLSEMELKNQGIYGKVSEDRTNLYRDMYELSPFGEMERNGAPDIFRSASEPKGPPDPRASIPEFRSKSGMDVDVLNEMKASQINKYGDTELDMFVARHTGAPLDPDALPKRMGSAVSDMRPDGSMPKHAEELVWSDISKDPVGYVAQLRGMDEGSLSMLDPAKRRKLVDEMADKYGIDEAIVSKGPKDVDKLTQELANYFTSEEYDPGPARPSFKQEMDTFNASQGDMLASGYSKGPWPEMERFKDGQDRFFQWLDDTRGIDVDHFDRMKEGQRSLYRQQYAKEEAPELSNPLDKFDPETPELLDGMNPDNPPFHIEDFNRWQVDNLPDYQDRTRFDFQNKRGIEDAHEGQKSFEGGLYEFDSDLHPGESLGFKPYLKQIGMTWDSFYELPPQLQKHVVNAYRASRGK